MEAMISSKINNFSTEQFKMNGQRGICCILIVSIV